MIKDFRNPGAFEVEDCGIIHKHLEQQRVFFIKSPCEALKGLLGSHFNFSLFDRMKQVLI